MTSIWLISYFVLWGLVLLEGLLLFALARQIGLLHERLRPFGARMMNTGPQIGSPVAALEATDMFGRPIKLGIEHGVRTLMVFISPTCPSCEQLLPGLRALERAEHSNLEVLLISAEDNAEACQALMKKYQLGAIPLIASDEMGKRYEINAVPYALLIDRDGILRAKGLANNLSQLESLLNAEELGHPSLESVFRARETPNMLVSDVPLETKSQEV